MNIKRTEEREREKNRAQKPLAFHTESEIMISCHECTMLSKCQNLLSSPAAFHPVLSYWGQSQPNNRKMRMGSFFFFHFHSFVFFFPTSHSLTRWTGWLISERKRFATKLAVFTSATDAGAWTNFEGADCRWWTIDWDSDTSRNIGVHENYRMQ